MLNDRPFEVPPYLVARCTGMAPVRAAIMGAHAAPALAGARAASEAGIIEPVLVGEEEAIRTHARALEWDISRFEVVNAGDEEETARTAVRIAACSEASILMKGEVHTDTLIRAIMQKKSGMRTGRRLSHAFHMTVPGSERVLHITDAAVNVAPRANTFIHIVNNAVELAQGLGTAEPRVALLSATETANDGMPSSRMAEQVRERALGGEVTGALVGGPFAFDNAVSPTAAAMKGIDDPVAGNADILVVPNIETGNGLFKMMVWFMGATAAGILLGARVPIVLTSRADPPEARLSAAIIAALMSAAKS